MADDYTGEFHLVDGGALTGAGRLLDTWTDLADYTQSLRNILARPGTFDDLFPETTDDMLVQVLMDGLAECHLEQSLHDHRADADGLVRLPLDSSEAALVVLMAGIRLIRAELLNRITNSRYVAGPVSAETTYATNILRDIMKALEAQKVRLLEVWAGGTAAASAFEMADAYVSNAWPCGLEPLRAGWR